MEYQHGAGAAVGRVAEHGAVDVEGARLAVAEHDLAFDRLLPGKHPGHQPLQLAVADDLRQQAARGPARIGPQQPRGGRVHAEHVFVGVDGQHALDHAG